MLWQSLAPPWPLEFPRSNRAAHVSRDVSVQDRSLTSCGASPGSRGTTSPRPDSGTWWRREPYRSGKAGRLTRRPCRRTARLPDTREVPRRARGVDIAILAPCRGKPKHNRTRPRRSRCCTRSEGLPSSCLGTRFRRAAACRDSAESDLLRRPLSAVRRALVPAVPPRPPAPRSPPRPPMVQELATEPPRPPASRPPAGSRRHRAVAFPTGVGRSGTRPRRRRSGVRFVSKATTVQARVNSATTSTRRTWCSTCTCPSRSPPCRTG